MFFKFQFLGLFHVVKFRNLAGDIFAKFGNQKSIHGGGWGGLVLVAGGWWLVVGWWSVVWQVHFYNMYRCEPLSVFHFWN
tara:strand:+ start:1510 stop:1749 length:240 start_codon:yes stop_codon:yes gene_type:complete